MDGKEVADFGRGQCRLMQHSEYLRNVTVIAVVPLAVSLAVAKHPFALFFPLL